MVNEFQWETNQMEGGNYESFESFETLGEQGEVYGEQGEAYGESDEQEGVYESSYGEQEGVYGEGSFGEQENGAVFNETQEMELAAELLSLSNEQELEQFLGNLIRSAGKAVGGFIKSPVGQALGGVLKGAARQALPIVGGAIGGAIGGSSGANIGRTLAGKAGQIFGLELEGLSGEDQEFEVARRFVRFAGAAAGRAARAPGQAPPRAVARVSAIAAARRHAPGLLRGGAGQRRAQQPQGFRSRRGIRRGGGRGRPWPGGAGYGFPVSSPAGGAGTANSSQDGDQAAAGGLNGGQDPGGLGDDQDPAGFGASPDTAAGGTASSDTTGPIAQRGYWTRQGRRLTIQL